MPTIEITGPTTTSGARAATRALARAAVTARSAPSVFNSQPWRWRIATDVAELRADRQRQLRSIDPDGRLLTISCGAALHHACTALAGAGGVCDVKRWPDPSDPDLLARLELTDFGRPEPIEVRRQQAMALRRTDRRPFADVDVPDEALDRLRAAAEANGAHLHLLRPDDVVALAVTVSRAAAVEFADPAYRAELAAWTTRPADDREGVPATTAADQLPRPVPLRDFTPGAQPRPAGAELADRHARYAVLLTDADDPAAWLRAGEALSALLLAATMDRLAVSPISDVVEVPGTRAMLRSLLGAIGYPALAVRVGVPADTSPPPAARRPAGQTVNVDMSEERQP